MSYLSRLAEYADAMLHGSTAQQVGGLCYRKCAEDGVEVLLITTREAKLWTIPKGWAMKGLATDGTLRPSASILTLLETPTTRSHFPEQGQRNLVWLQASEAALLVD
ncbi:hypothetical protein [Rhizobium tubonense]|uniref:Uncharacterized protein n=1 Tax=Rhizobium tubonense TaxID=484088 RepID=A0A2W4C5L1_9HYPH|nr:hypothetical protein [Rhizobium tubonense]PZM08341.1 hypothetical protein CPY51_29230 [Rhizobium tubonense]